MNKRNIKTLVFICVSSKIFDYDFLYLSLLLTTSFLFFYPNIENEVLQIIFAMDKPRIVKVNEELQWLVKRYNS